MMMMMMLGDAVPWGQSSMAAAAEEDAVSLFPSSVLGSKSALRGLNERFSGYVERVRLLEAQREALEEEARRLRQGQAGRMAMVELYGREVMEMRLELGKAQAGKAQEKVEAERALEVRRRLQERIVQEERRRVAAESAIRIAESQALRDRDQASHLRRRLQALEEEGEEIRSSHRERVQGMMGMAVLRAEEEEDAAEVPSGKTSGRLAQALKEVRAQMEEVPGYAEEWFRGGPLLQVPSSTTISLTSSPTTLTFT